jgi:hypothetical protein
LYDYEEYSKKCGLNLDLFSEDVSRVVTTENLKLKELLENDYDFSATENFVKKYLSVPACDCSKRLAEFVISLI